MISISRFKRSLTSAAGSFGILGYSYDPNGNRLAETRNAGILPYVYSPPNWLYQKSSDTHTKTASGNTVSSTASASAPRKSTRTASPPSSTTAPTANLLYEQDANGNTRVYVWLDGRPLARIDNDAQIYYYHVDHLGTPQAMTNAAGTTVWKADYEPFGKATVKVNTVENNLRFPGQYYDRETGLHYNYFRDYDPQTGRYVEADPIGLDGGINLYGYANQNPLMFSDPDGLDPLPKNKPEAKWMSCGKCADMLRDLAEHNRQCEAELSSCKTDADEIRFIEKYDGSGFSSALHNCKTDGDPTFMQRLLMGCWRCTQQVRLSR